MKKHFKMTQNKRRVLAIISSITSEEKDCFEKEEILEAGWKDKTNIQRLLDNLVDQELILKEGSCYKLSKDFNDFSYVEEKKVNGSILVSSSEYISLIQSKIVKKERKIKELNQQIGIMRELKKERDKLIDECTHLESLKIKMEKDSAIAAAVQEARMYLFNE